jgi:DNA segregation ATPase FtsK/SpoIIIE, S-DNA-T family
MFDPAALNALLRSFKINAECIGAKKIRHVSFYDLQLAPATRIKTIEKYSAEISLALKAKSPATVKLVPELGIVRLEIIDSNPEELPLFDHLKNLTVPNAIFPAYLGCSLDGSDIWMDIAENPHMLIGGATGSGKSTLLHVILANALRKSNTHISIIDTKAVEYGVYKKYEHVKIANDYTTAMGMLSWIYNTMEWRYRLMNDGVLPYSAFSHATKDHPHILVVIDEFADLVSVDEWGQLVERLCKIVQKCRAAGIYFVLATQRPSVDVIPGVIKANMPARLACKVASGVDSRVVLDVGGAERLMGKGDCIINNYNHNYTRFQIAWTTPDEIANKI